MQAWNLLVCTVNTYDPKNITHHREKFAELQFTTIRSREHSYYFTTQNGRAPIPIWIKWALNKSLPIVGNKPDASHSKLIFCTSHRPIHCPTPQIQRQPWNPCYFSFSRISRKKKISEIWFYKLLWERNEKKVFGFLTFKTKREKGSWKVKRHESKVRK